MLCLQPSAFRVRSLKPGHRGVAGGPHVLAATNRSKSDRDPASWQPPNREVWCDFATDWATVKIRWRLTADEDEVRALRNMLRGC